MEMTEISLLYMNTVWPAQQKKRIIDYTTNYNNQRKLALLHYDTRRCTAVVHDNRYRNFFRSGESLVKLPAFLRMLKVWILSGCKVSGFSSACFKSHAAAFILSLIRVTVPPSVALLVKREPETPEKLVTAYTRSSCIPDFHNADGISLSIIITITS